MRGGGTRAARRSSSSSGVRSSEPFPPGPGFVLSRAGARDPVRAAGPGRTAAGRNSAQPLAPGAVGGPMRTEPSTEKPPPCSHCPIACASSPGSRPRRTKTRSKRRRTHACTAATAAHRARRRRGRQPRPQWGVEHAVDDDAMKVQVGIERRAKAVDEGYGAEARRGA